MNLAVANTELALDEHTHPFDRPQRRAKAMCSGSLKQAHLQPRQLLGTELRRTPALAHVAKRIQTFGLEHVAPAIYGLARRSHLYGDLRGWMPGLEQSRSAYATL